MKKLLTFVIQIVTEITLLLSTALVIYVLVTGGGIFTIGPIVIRSHGLICLLVILTVACVLRKIVTGHFRRGFFTVSLVRWGRTQIRRLTERWIRSSQFRRQALLGLIVCILLAIGVNWLRSAVTIERGLVGRYYTNPDFEGKPEIVALDAGPHLLRAQTLWKEWYSIEWTGAVYIAIPGKYEFLIGSDDGSALYIGEQLVVDNSGYHGLTDRSGVIKLKRGFAPLRLRYNQGTQASALQVLWKAPGQKRHQALPGTVLFPEQPIFMAFFLERLVAAGWIGIQVLGMLGLVIIAFAGVAHRKILWLVGAACVGKAWRWLNRVFGAAFLARFFRLMNAENRWFGCKHSSWVLHGLILLLFSLLIIYNNLGGWVSVDGADEKIHTRVANTIVNTGNWWNLEYHGKPYTQKPPLKIWLSAMTFRYIGDTEFWVRFWDATFALGTMCAVYVFGRKWLNPLTGLVSALILCLSFNYIYDHNARSGVQDSAMIFFFTLSIVLFWFRARGTRCYFLAGLAMACSSLTKLWMGVGALVIMIGYMILAGKFKEIWRRDFLIMALISILLPLAWLIPHVLSVPGFFRAAVAANIVGRITGTFHSDFAKGPWYFYAITLYQRYQPWVLFLPFALGYGMYQGLAKKAQVPLLLLVWSIVVFGGFSAAKLRLSWYINPVFPACALLIGSFFYAVLQWGYRKFKVQSPFLITCLLVGLSYLFADTTVAMYRFAVKERATHPIQNFVVYLEKNMRTTPYYVVLYHTDPDEDVKNQEHYYLNRIRERVVYLDTLDALQDFLAQTTAPTFVLLKNTDFRTSAFFKKHELVLPLPISDGPNKRMAIYHYALLDDFPLAAKQQ